MDHHENSLAPNPIFELSLQRHGHGSKKRGYLIGSIFDAKEMTPGLRTEAKLIAHPSKMVGGRLDRHSKGENVFIFLGLYT